MKISIIVATDNHGVIGHQNQIPWHLPADLRYFKRTTLGHCVIMGRKCFDSIGKPLPGRHNIVITRNADLKIEGCDVVTSLEAALQIAAQRNETEVFIAGGGEIYNIALPLTDRVYLTRVKLDAIGDIVFPALDPDHWVNRSIVFHNADSKNAYDYTYYVLDKVAF